MTETLQQYQHVKHNYAASWSVPLPLWFWKEKYPVASCSWPVVLISTARVYIPEPDM